MPLYMDHPGALVILLVPRSPAGEWSAASVSASDNAVLSHGAGTREV